MPVQPSRRIEIVETWGRKRLPRPSARAGHVALAAALLGVLVAPLALAADKPGYVLEVGNTNARGGAARLVCMSATRPCLSVRNPAGGPAAKFVSSAGKPPFQVGPDATKVPNLNADLLDGMSAAQIIAKAGPGPTGPQGPQGAKGDTGPQGPSGSDAQFNGAGAGGDLAGTYPNPTLRSSLDDGPAGTPTLRSLGTGAAQAAAGNDVRLSDARAPTGTAGGDLTGSSYPNPTLGSGSIESTALFASGSIPAAVVRRTGLAAQPLGSGSVITWLTEEADTAGLFDPTQPTKLTAPVDGIYGVDASLFVSAVTAPTTCFLNLETITPSATAASSWFQAVPPGALAMSVATHLALQAGQSVDVFVRCLSGDGFASANPDRFSMTWLAPKT